MDDQVCRTKLRARRDQGTRAPSGEGNDTCRYVYALVGTENALKPLWGSSVVDCLDAKLLKFFQRVCRANRGPVRGGAHRARRPHAHVNGARVDDGCFLATGAALFPGCVTGAGSEVRIGGVVHVNTVLPPGTTVPIGWVAVGDPARIFPPGQHEQIWAIQEPLNFPGTVYGVTRDTPAAERMSRQSAWFAAHLADRVIGTDANRQDDRPGEGT